jgi:hypothetical protein
MKDAKGHGSEARGGGGDGERGMRAGRGVTGVQARNNRMFAMFDRAKAQGHTGLYSGPDGSDARGGGSLTDAAREKVGIGKMIDETHYPSRTPTDLEAMQSLASGPKSAPVAVHDGAAGPQYGNNPGFVKKHGLWG